MSRSGERMLRTAPIAFLMLIKGKRGAGVKEVCITDRAAGPCAARAACTATLV
jgi:hypothetical protein